MIIRDGKEDYFLTILDWPDYFLKEIYPKIEIILISTEPDYHITDNICSFHDVTQEEIIKLRNNDNCFLVINWIELFKYFDFQILSLLSHTIGIILIHEYAPLLPPFNLVCDFVLCILNSLSVLINFNTVLSIFGIISI